MALVRAIIPRGGNDETKFTQITEPSLKKIGVQVLQIMEKDPSKPENIFLKYNAGIEAMFQTDLQDDDIVVFLHSDLAIIDNFFKSKVDLIFQEKKDVGLIGIAGSTEMTELGGWWMNKPLSVDIGGNYSGALVGHLIQGKSNGDMNQGNHLIKGPIGYFDNVVAVDGCILITQGKFIKEGIKFDDVSYQHNDFYDIDLCMQFLERGYKVAVADILVYHQSEGKGVFHENWKSSKEIFLNKWKSKGYTFPLDQSQFHMKPEVKSTLMEIEI